MDVGDRPASTALRASKDTCPQGEAGFHLKQESVGNGPRGPRFPEGTKDAGKEERGRGGHSSMKLSIYTVIHDQVSLGS